MAWKSLYFPRKKSIITTQNKCDNFLRARSDFGQMRKNSLPTCGNSIRRRKASSASGKLIICNNHALVRYNIALIETIADFCSQIFSRCSARINCWKFARRSSICRMAAKKKSSAEEIKKSATLLLSLLLRSSFFVIFEFFPGHRANTSFGNPLSLSRTRNGNCDTQV